MKFRTHHPWPRMLRLVLRTQPRSPNSPPREKQIHEQGLVSVLKQIHDDLDAAVFAAHGWDDLVSCSGGLRPPSVSADPGAHRGAATADIDEIILERLVALNHERAEEEKRGHIRWLRPEFQNPEDAAKSTQTEIAGMDESSGGQTTSPSPGGLEALGKRRKEFAAGEDPEGVERAGASESLGRGEGETPRKKTATAKSKWPKELSAQVAAIQTALENAGAPVTAAELAKGFQRASKDRIAEILETLAALGKAKIASDGKYQKAL